MKQPRCRLCGAHHWTHEPHVFDETAAQPEALPKAGPLPKALPKLEPESLPKTAGPNTPGSRRQARWREKHRGQYNEYQRELMRRRTSGG